MKRQKNRLEWAVFGGSLLLVGAAMSLLAYQAWVGGTSSPQLDVVLGEPTLHGDAFAVPLSVKNRGDETAENVQIEITLEIAGESEITSSLMLPYVPRHAMREGFVVFQKDPRLGQLRVRLVGYTLP